MKTIRITTLCKRFGVTRMALWHQFFKLKKANICKATSEAEYAIHVICDEKLDEFLATYQPRRKNRVYAKKKKLNPKRKVSEVLGNYLDA